MNESLISESLQLDPDSNIPLIAQLTQQITWLIASGELKAGDKLPSMRELAEALSVHMHTVRQAYQRLEADSLVSIRTRRGTVVLAYDPAAVAARAADSPSYLLGVILPNPVSFYAPFIQQIQEESRDLRYLPLFCYTYENPYLTDTYFNQLIARGVDGFIITSLSLPSVLEDPSLLNHYPPIVTVDMPDMPGYRILIDTEGAAYRITKHLLGHNRQRIGLITPPLEWPNVTPFFDGYKKALAEQGMSVDPELIAVVDGFFETCGQVGAEQLLSLDQPPDAIVAAADTLALGAMGILQERGIKIPGNIALAGFDDIRAASLVQPGLTTASIPAAEIGSLAVETLQKLISGKKLNQEKILIPTELVLRSSCGCQ